MTTMSHTLTPLDPLTAAFVACFMAILGRSIRVDLRRCELLTVSTLSDGEILLIQLDSTYPIKQLAKGIETVTLITGLKLSEVWQRVRASTISVSMA